MIWEPEVQMLHFILPDHENRMLERIFAGTAEAGGTSGTARNVSAPCADHPARCHLEPPAPPAPGSAPPPDDPAATASAPAATPPYPIEPQHPPGQVRRCDNPLSPSGLEAVVWCIHAAKPEDQAEVGLDVLTRIRADATVRPRAVVDGQHLGTDQLPVLRQGGGQLGVGGAPAKGDAVADVQAVALARVLH